MTATKGTNGRTAKAQPGGNGAVLKDARGRFVKGTAKPAGAGSRVGFQSRAREAQAICASHCYDPLDARLEYRLWLRGEYDAAVRDLNRLERILGKPHDDPVALAGMIETRRLAHSQSFRILETMDRIDDRLMDYVYPRRKAVEIERRDSDPTWADLSLDWANRERERKAAGGTDA